MPHAHVRRPAQAHAYVHAYAHAQTPNAGKRAERTINPRYMYVTVPARRSSRLSAQKASDNIEMAVAKNGRVDDTGMSAGKKFVKRYVGGERALCELTFWYWSGSKVYTKMQWAQYQKKCWVVLNFKLYETFANTLIKTTTDSKNL